MTPLAQRIVNHNLTLPVRERDLDELHSSNCHCFEISEILGLITDLVANHDWKVKDDLRIFLPSPITWIEWKTEYGRSAGLLRQKNDQPDYIYIDSVEQHSDGQVSMSDYPFALGRDGKAYDTTENPKIRMEKDRLFVVTRMFAAALSLINSPKIIGQRNHLPHAGLQKKIALSHGMVGKFPLKAWTEINLRVSAPKEITGQPYDSHLTGGKALHFCRAHLRMRLGKVEFVNAHWRGDPAIGIKRTRYSAKP